MSQGAINLLQFLSSLLTPPACLPFSRGRDCFLVLVVRWEGGNAFHAIQNQRSHLMFRNRTQKWFGCFLTPMSEVGASFPHLTS